MRRCIVRLAKPKLGLDASWQEAADYYTPEAILTHKQHVMRLYRKSLRVVNSWAENRDVFNKAACDVRAQFDACMDVEPGGPEAKRMLREGREKLAAQAHPDPYIQAYMPGGTLFMRNPPFPLELLYDGHIPEGVSNRRVNIDYSNVPEGQKYANKVFVDSANKTYYMDK